MPEGTLALTAENFPDLQHAADLRGISLEELGDRIIEGGKRVMLILSNRAHLTLEDACFAKDITFWEHTAVCGFCRRLVEPFNSYSECKFPCVFPNAY